jgi:hypothetical protein
MATWYRKEVRTEIRFSWPKHVSLIEIHRQLIETFRGDVLRPKNGPLSLTCSSPQQRHAVYQEIMKLLTVYYYYYSSGRFQAVRG